MSLVALAAASAALVAWAPTPVAPIVIDGRPISRGHLRHWADIMRRMDIGASRRQAAMALISFRWLREEARDRGVVVTRAEVRHEFKLQRREAFPELAHYRHFLRTSGQSPADVRVRVRASVFSNRLRDLAIAGATTPEAEQAQLDAFLVEYRRKWRARTTCHRPWVTRACGEVR